jgi:hypothetical protein
LEIGGRNLLPYSELKRYRGGYIYNDLLYYSISNERIIATNQTINSDLPGWVLHLAGPTQITVSGTTDATEVRVYYRCYNDIGVALTGQSSFAISVVDGKFSTTRILNFPIDTANVNIGIGANIGNYWLKPKLEIGNKATDWTPAPEDQVSDWDTTDATSFSFIKNKPTQLSQFTDNIGVATHIANKSNPHGVTKAQVGLGNVRNVASYSQSEAENRFYNIYSPTGYLPTSITDLNDLNAGQRGLANTQANRIGSGFNDVVTISQYGSSDLLQIIYPFRGDGKFYLRNKQSSGWSDWLKVWHSGNLANGTTSQYIRGDGSLATYSDTTYSAMSVAEGTAGTATSLRTMRADYLKQIIQHYDTNSVTGIRAGASGTTTNSTATNPYIKVIDDNTYRSQIKLVGSGATTVSSDASGNITISSTDTNTTYSTGTLAQLNAGTDTTGRLQTAKLLNDWLNPKLDGKLNLSGGTLTGIIENNKNGLRLGNRVFQGNYPTSHTGIRSLVIPSRGATTVFNVAINIYGHSSKYQGRFVFGFYKQTATSINATVGNIGYFTGTTNFPFKDIHAGIDIDGNVRINMGNPSTNWGGYVSIDVEKSENFYSNYNKNWGDGWTIEHIVGEPSGFQSIVKIPISEGITGNAATATTLATARTINGTNFNGSANITTAN